MTEQKKAGGLSDFIGMMVLILVLILVLCLVPGCGTIAGLGEDLHHAANWTAERIDNGFNRPEK